jgi:DNA-binding NarL/FixJ family response regulator
MVKKELLHAYSTLEATGGAMAVSIAIKKGFIVGPDISQMPFHLLAPHEWGVGKALVYGSSDMMAKRLFVSERTVKNWISSASQKLGISGRVALAGAISKHLLQG